jgi:hypothetical protein
MDGSATITLDGVSSKHVHPGSGEAITGRTAPDLVAYTGHPLVFYPSFIRAIQTSIAI